tara:strand:- start:6445 stop:6894 length:450 start_codon:yes stop_codon:yes gene_type:complete
MFDIHIEEFYHDAFKTMLSLYQAFPKKSNIYVEDIAGPDQPDEYGLHSDRFQSCFGTILWLELEGFIRFESTLRQEAADQACLTMKGLTTVSSICQDRFLNTLSKTILPENLGLSGRPNIETLKHISHHGTSTQLALAMQHLLKTFANY